VLAREEVVGYVPVPALWLGGGEGFAVRVLTDSMAPTVAPGDIAVVRGQQAAVPGDIVVALFEEETVLKRFAREVDTVLLTSDNPAYAPLRFPQGEALREPQGGGLRILGKVVGLLRRFNGSTAAREQLHRTRPA
jgi:repressor LexA